MTDLLYQLLDAARRRPWVTATLGLAVALGGANYYLWRQREALAREHDAISQRGEWMLAALVDREQVGNDLRRLKDALATVNDNLVAEADMEVNLGYFYKTEKATRVRLTQLSQLSTPPSPEGNTFKAIPISLRAAGTYPQLMTFMRQLETGPRILSIRSFSLGVADTKSSAMSLDLTVEMLGK